jgi:hypothetical protein
MPTDPEKSPSRTIGVAPRLVDILTSIDAVGFDEAWSGRLEAEIEGLRINVLGREHLLRNERASGRPIDLADASWLEAQGGIWRGGQVAPKDRSAGHAESVRTQRTLRLQERTNL